jgi:hypothetical protein
LVAALLMRDARVARLVFCNGDGGEAPPHLAPTVKRDAVAQLDAPAPGSS